jgi:hypothetical protein
MTAASMSPPRSRFAPNNEMRYPADSDPRNGVNRDNASKMTARIATSASEMPVPSAAATVCRRAPSVMRNVAIVTPKAAPIATQAGSQPARINGTTSLTTTARVSARAISERTPRQPPTTVTAPAKSTSSSARVGTR